jgi:hypothetical protein
MLSHPESTTGIIRVLYFTFHIFPSQHRSQLISDSIMTFFYHLYSVMDFQHIVVAVTDDGSEIFKFTDFSTSLLFAVIYFCLFRLHVSISVVLLCLFINGIFILPFQVCYS